MWLFFAGILQELELCEESLGNTPCSLRTEVSSRGKKKSNDCEQLSYNYPQQSFEKIRWFFFFFLKRLLLPKPPWRPQEIVVNVKQHFMAGRWAKNTSCFPESGPSVGASADLWSCFVPWNWMFDRKIWLVMHLNGLCHSLACRHCNFFFFSKSSFSKCYSDTRFCFYSVFLPLSLVCAAVVGKQNATLISLLILLPSCHLALISRTERYHSLLSRSGMNT